MKKSMMFVLPLAAATLLAPGCRSADREPSAAAHEEASPAGHKEPALELKPRARMARLPARSGVRLPANAPAWVREGSGTAEVEGVKVVRAIGRAPLEKDVARARKVAGERARLELGKVMGVADSKAIGEAQIDKYWVDMRGGSIYARATLAVGKTASP